MATKQAPLNQHIILHQHYPDNCCLCREEDRVSKLKSALRTLTELIQKQENLDPEIRALVDAHFWDLI